MVSAFLTPGILEILKPVDGWGALDKFPDWELALVIKKPIHGAIHYLEYGKDNYWTRN